MFMSPNREGASSIRFPKDITYIHRAVHLYKHPTGGLTLGQRIFLSLLFLHKNFNTVEKTRIWSNEAMHPTAVYQFKAHVIQDN